MVALTADDGGKDGKSFSADAHDEDEDSIFDDNSDEFDTEASAAMQSLGDDFSPSAQRTDADSFEKFLNVKNDREHYALALRSIGPRTQRIGTMPSSRGVTRCLVRRSKT